MRTDMALPLPCRLAPGTRVERGARLAWGEETDVLRPATPDDDTHGATWAAEPLDADRCDRVDMDVFTGAVREAREEDDDDA